MAARRADQRNDGGNPEAERYDEWIHFLGAAPQREVVAPTTQPRAAPRPLPPVERRAPLPPQPRGAGPGHPHVRWQVWHDMVYADWDTRRTGGYPLVEPSRGRRYFLATFVWTVAWYAVPAAVFAAWSLTFPAAAGTACARPSNNACPPPRTAAVQALLHGLPQVGIALVVGLLVAGLIRLGSAAWRPVATGFAAAIVGAGLTTVLYSALHSIG